MSGKIHMVPALVNDKYIIRFAVCAQNANDDDINFAWNVISEMASEVIEACDSNRDSEEAVERMASIEIEDDESLKTNGVLLEPVAEINPGEKAEADASDEDEVFLYDDNIPSIPSLPTRYEVTRTSAVNPHKRRNLLLRMISDPKCYNPRVLRSLSQDGKQDGGKRRLSESQQTNRSRGSRGSSGDCDGDNNDYVM